MFGIKTRIKKYLKDCCNEFLSEKADQAAIIKNNLKGHINPILKERQERQAVERFYTSWNIKVLAALNARQRIEKLNKSLPIPDAPQLVGLTSKIAAQEDLESSWGRYWLDQLKIKFRYHRKNWEYAFVLQALYENGMFGKKGLGFACGEEPIPAYLVSRGCSITGGDKPIDCADCNQEAWKSSSQYTRDAESLFKPELLSREEFAAGFRLKYIDMNNLPADSRGEYDFIWSICAAEHLGSLKHGLEFMANSLDLLKPGGIAVHTTEYNLFSDNETFENEACVIFRRKDFANLRSRLEAKKTGEMYSFNDWSGELEFDEYIDQEPYSATWKVNAPNIFKTELNLDYYVPHLRLLLGGFPATCAGIILKKAGNGPCDPR